VQITIQTSGSSISVSLHSTPRNLNPWYALALPTPGLLLLGFSGLSRRRRQLRGTQWVCFGMISLLLFGVVSCGGHFTPPASSQSGSGANPQVTTPAGTYYVTVVDTPTNGNLNGFPQTSLIVPLPVVTGSH
jgi:drug/metabolite transporter (DMT)-like permease